MEEDIQNLSDYECANLIKELIQRLEITSYGRGYKDGFNDGKESELQRQVMNNAIKEANNSGILL